jgi:stalled ribosome rescue protein Dom34
MLPLTHIYKINIFQMGAYHTLDLELNRKFSLIKPEWDSISLERVELACDPTQVLIAY